MTSDKKLLLNELVASLRDDPTTWRWGDVGDGNSYLTHKGGLHLWVYCGEAHLYDPNIHFGFFGKRRLRAAFRHWRRVQGAMLIAQREANNVARALLLLRGAA